MNAARENLPAPKISGVEVSKINDITGKEEPQKKIVEKIAKIKGRESSQTFLMVASSIDQLRDLSLIHI